jgi:type IV secretory pathway VirB4 component
MKKYLPDEDSNNISYRNTDIKPNGRLLICGPSGSGKSNSLMQYLHLSPNTFARICIIYKTDEPFYQYLREELKGSIVFYNSLSKLPRVEKLEESMESGDRLLVVFDDQIKEVCQPKYSYINDYYTFGRKLNISTIFLSQSYYDVPKYLRQQMNAVLLFKLSSKRDLDIVLSDYTNEITPDALKAIYKNATDQKMSFLKITTGACPVNKRFAKGFKDFYEIERSSLAPQEEETNGKST